MTKTIIVDLAARSGVGTMIEGDMLVSKDNASKTYDVVDAGHWSKIVSDDGQNETFMVKFLGADPNHGELYISTDGQVFVLWPDNGPLKEIYEVF